MRKGVRVRRGGGEGVRRGGGGYKNLSVANEAIGPLKNEHRRISSTPRGKETYSVIRETFCANFVLRNQ